MPNERLLPIKVVLPRADDYQAPFGGGGETKYFGEFTDALRNQFSAQVRAVNEHFAYSFSTYRDVPAVAKVKLKKEAVAKSHRPNKLFAEDTCPVIGANKLGELYVTVSPGRLNALGDRFKFAATNREKAQMTAIEKIEPYSLHDAVDASLMEVFRAQLKKDGKVSRLRCRLFRHDSPRENGIIRATFDALIQTHSIKNVKALDYAADLFVFRLEDVSTDAMAALGGFAGTQNLSLFPNYRIVRSTARIIGNVSATYLPPPEAKREYGVVGIIDSGTDPENTHLQAWVLARHEFVPRTMQNNDHGSFVAGLIAQGRALNHQDLRFPGDPAKIVDIVALDKNGEISEYDLLAVIDDAIARFPQVKVWNLSLGLVGQSCLDHEFSMLGAALDERSARHGVLFVIAAGNYANSPFRTWPPQAGLDDRICPPADAVRAITVGSLAHIDSASSCVKREEPSPFSRRGPGPAYLMKPEMSHYGGNCDAKGGYVQTGIVSVDGNGHVAEDIGTSFACALVSPVAANVSLELSVEGGTPSPTLVKAMLVHSAFLRSAPLDHSTMTYRGLGPPSSVDEIVSCRQSSATIILQIPVQPKPEFGKRPFPMPKGLIEDGVLKGEVFMTLLYDPRMDRSYGIEYCRSNVNASLGLMGEDVKKKGKLVYDRQIHPAPKAITEGYEEDLVKSGFKWSPLKLYYRNFQRGPAIGPWRLTLEMLNRAEVPEDEIQDVVLIVTIRAANPEARIYDELVTEMTRLNWGATNLLIRSESRIQG